MTIHLPYHGRVLLRTVAVWGVLRLLLGGLQAALDAQVSAPGAGGQGLHPAAALGLIGVVIGIDVIHARVMHEVTFRANAGISTASVIVPVAVLLASLEVLVRWWA